MKPLACHLPPQEDLFRHQLDNLLDSRHELYCLAQQISWAQCGERFRPKSSLHCSITTFIASHHGTEINLQEKAPVSLASRLLALPACQVRGIESIYHFNLIR